MKQILIVFVFVILVLCQAHDFQRGFPSDFSSSNSPKDMEIGRLRKKIYNAWANGHSFVYPEEELVTEIVQSTEFQTEMQHRGFNIRTCNPNLYGVSGYEPWKSVAVCWEEYATANK